MDCANLVKSCDDDALPPGAVGIHTSSLAHCIRTSNQYIWELADIRSETVAAGRSVKVMEQVHGLKFNADGVLFKQHLRGVHKPIEHYIRD